MSPRILNIALAVMAAGFSGTGALAADDASMIRDLKATIALQGLPCDEIVDAKRNADSDYLATCKDGNRYHIFVNPQGRVMVEKQ
jgi:dienelactone hydrolase